MEEKNEKSKLFRIADRIEMDFKAKNEQVPINQISINADVSHSTVARFFNGEGYPRIDTVEKIAKALGYDFYELLCDECREEHIELSEEQRKYQKMIREFSAEEVQALKIMVNALWCSHHMGERRLRKKDD